MPTSYSDHHWCHRCGQAMTTRSTSYFTGYFVCIDCLNEEGRVMKALRDRGVNVAPLEGCGYLPDPAEYRPKRSAVEAVTGRGASDAERQRAPSDQRDRRVTYPIRGGGGA